MGAEVVNARMLRPGRLDCLMIGCVCVDMNNFADRRVAVRGSDIKGDRACRAEWGDGAAKVALLVSDDVTTAARDVAVGRQGERSHADDAVGEIQGVVYQQIIG